MLTTIIIVVAIILILWVVFAFLSWYRIVAPTEAHLVISPKSKRIVSSDDTISTDGKRTYFAIPEYIPFIGRNVRMMDLTIQEIVKKQISYEKNQARFNVTSSTKYRIKNVAKAAETFDNDDELKTQLEEVIVSSVNAIASKYDVVEMRSKKQEMSQAIHKEMEDDLQQWGLSLISFQLIDFLDTEDSKIISNISKRREVEIESRTREENAEKVKAARMKEAESDELAKTREIKRDQTVSEREENKKQKVAEQEKLAEEKRFEVVQVQLIKQAEIDKEKAIIEANQRKETEAINKEQKKLEGEGDRLRAEENAKGEAAPIREKGFAEAEAKSKLQEALKKFDDNAIRALVAEKIVEMQKDVGIESAKALKEADVRVFAGEGGKEGFDLGKLVSSVSVSNDGTAMAILNKIARSGDLGFTRLPEDVKASEKPKSKKSTTTNVNPMNK